MSLLTSLTRQVLYFEACALDAYNRAQAAQSATMAEAYTARSVAYEDAGHRLRSLIVKQPGFAKALREALREVYQAEPGMVLIHRLRRARAESDWRRAGMIRAELLRRAEA